jgi:CHAT domain-containing protein/Flp pilus assembly protein TadD
MISESQAQSSASDYFNEGIQYYNQGKYTEALANFENARKKAATDYGTSHGYYGQITNACAMMNNFLGNYAQAELLLLDAKRIFLSAYGRYHDDYAGACNNLGIFYNQRGKYADAEKQFNEALEIYKSTKGRLSMNYSMVLDNLSLTYRNQGNYYKAASYVFDSQSIMEDLKATDTKDYALSCNNLGKIYILQERYQQAEVMYGKSMDIVNRLYPEDHPDKIPTWENMAVVYYLQANYDKSEEYLQKAKSFILTFYDAQHPQYANYCDLLAKVYVEKKKYTSADSLYTIALSIYQSKEGANSIHYLNVECNRAVLYNRNGRSAEALEIYQKYKKALEEKQLTSTKDYFTVNFFIGKYYLEKNQLDLSETYLTEAVRFFQDDYSKKTVSYVDAVSHLGLLYEKKGDIQKSVYYHKEMYTQLVLFVKDNFNFLTDHEKNVYLKSNENYFNQFYSFILNHPELNHTMDGDFYNLLLNIKGLNYYSGKKLISGVHEMSSNQNLQSAYQAWKEKSSVQNRLMVQFQTPSVRKELEEVKLQTVELERKLLIARYYKMLAPNTVVYDWKNVQEKLQTGEALVDILRFTKIYSGKEKAFYVGVILTKETSAPILVHLSEAAFLETKALTYYRNSIKYKNKDNKSFNNFWAPVDSVLQKYTLSKIYYSPDGVYNIINLNTLLDPSSNKYLIHQYKIQTLISGRDLLNYYESSQPITSVVLLGYPIYAVSSGSATSSQQRQFSPLQSDTTQRYLTRAGSITMLPGTRLEVEAIYSMAMSQRMNSSLYMENTATEATLKKVVNPSVLHIATHGFFLQGVANNSNGERYMNYTSEDLAYAPLNKSGLLLAHCEPSVFNQSNQETEDGILTAQESLFLTLSKTELVVLSACETGLGDLVNGEGVYGLQRTFLQAGAKRVIMSLWTVSDEATQLLMTTFYEQLLIHKKTIRESFDLAQKSLMEKFPDPYYWGAFVLLGQP